MTRFDISARRAKTGSRSSNPPRYVRKRTSCCTFWFSSHLSTTNIKDSVCPWNIVILRYVFDLWPWPLTSTGNVTMKNQCWTHLGSSCEIWWFSLKKCVIRSFFVNFRNLTPAVTLTFDLSRSPSNRLLRHDLESMCFKFGKNRMKTFWFIVEQPKSDYLTLWPWPLTLTSIFFWNL